MARRVYKRAHASARFSGEALDPLEVTLALRIPPDHVHRVGELRLSRNGKGRIVELPPWRHGMWCFSSEKWVQSPQLARHLVWLLEQLEPKAKEIASLIAGGAKADFYCASTGSTERPPQISRVLQARAAVLGMTISIDHDVDRPRRG